MTKRTKINSHWTFNGASTRELTHCYHDYPARMIPQVAGKLIDMFAAVDATLLFDPYCGTGTSLVEGLIRGINVVGTDLNPLARLIAQAKTSKPDLRKVDREIARFNRYAIHLKAPSFSELSYVHGISRLEFWFKPQVVQTLARLKSFIERIEDIPVLFDHYLTDFSSDMGKPKPRVEKNALNIIVTHPWPGNVRELKNVVERAMILNNEDVIKV